MVQIISDRIIPFGKSLCGFLLSSANTLTASNPIYAKNTPLTAIITPLNPFGINDLTPSSLAGVQLNVRPFEKTRYPPTNTTNPTIANFNTTMALLKLRLSLIPR